METEPLFLEEGIDEQIELVNSNNQLILHHRNLSSNFPSLASLSHVTHLHIARCFLDAFPTQLFDLKHLEVLDISANNISHIPDALPREWRFSLKLLDISHNIISTFPSSLCKLERLEELYVSWNQIGLSSRTLPRQIGNLKELKILALNHNIIEQLPAEISMLPKLKKLDVSNNAIKYLPADFLFHRLEQFRFEGNDFYAPASAAVKSFLFDAQQEIPLASLTEISATALTEFSFETLPASLKRLYKNHCLCSFCSKDCFEPAVFIEFIPIVTRSNLSQIPFLHKLCAVCMRAKIIETRSGGFRLRQRLVDTGRIQGPLSDGEYSRVE